MKIGIVTTESGISTPSGYGNRVLSEIEQLAHVMLILRLFHFYILTLEKY